MQKLLGMLIFLQQFNVSTNSRCLYFLTRFLYLLQFLLIYFFRNFGQNETEKFELNKCEEILNIIEISPLLVDDTDLYKLPP